MASTIFYQDSTSMYDVLRQSAKKQLDSYADAWIVMFEGPKQIKFCIRKGN
jgi:hypothetical protein